MPQCAMVIIKVLFVKILELRNGDMKPDLFKNVWRISEILNLQKGSKKPAFQFSLFNVKYSKISQKMFQNESRGEIGIVW